MKRLSNLDLGGIARIINLPVPQNDTDSANRGYVLSEINKAISGLDYQSDVKGVQTDATLDPGTPAVGDRYILKNVAALHATFGTIADVANGDIVEYSGSAFTIAYDVSVKGDGVLVYNQGDQQWYKYTANTWTYGGLSAVVAGTALENIEGTFNVKYDNVTIGVDGNGKLFVKDDSIGKAKIASDVAGLGIEQDIDGSLKLKLDGASLSVGENGLKLAQTLLNKATADLGDGTATEITVVHTLNTEDVVVMVRSNTTPKDKVECDIEVVDDTHVKFKFVSAPTTNAYRAVIIG